MSTSSAGTFLPSEQMSLPANVWLFRIGSSPTSIVDPSSFVRTRTGMTVPSTGRLLPTSTNSQKSVAGTTWVKRKRPLSSVSDLMSL